MCDIMPYQRLLLDIDHLADNTVSEIELKAGLISLNVLESDLIQLDLIEHVVQDILHIRLKIQNRLGWFQNH